MAAFKKAENKPRAELGELFTDIYAGETPWNIVSNCLFQPLMTKPCIID
jgi:2-oxoisovalerate dehydrogenase E1 component alpha subunit